MRGWVIGLVQRKSEQLVTCEKPFARGFETYHDVMRLAHSIEGPASKFKLYSRQPIFEGGN